MNRREFLTTAAASGLAGPVAAANTPAAEMPANRGNVPQQERLVLLLQAVQEAAHEVLAAHNTLASEAAGEPTDCDCSACTEDIPAICYLLRCPEQSMLSEMNLSFYPLEGRGDPLREVVTVTGIPQPRLRFRAWVDSELLDRFEKLTRNPDHDPAAYISVAIGEYVDRHEATGDTPAAKPPAELPNTSGNLPQAEKLVLLLQAALDAADEYKAAHNALASEDDDDAECDCNICEGHIGAMKYNLAHSMDMIASELTPIRREGYDVVALAGIEGGSPRLRAKIDSRLLEQLEKLSARQGVCPGGHLQVALREYLAVHANDPATLSRNRPPYSEEGGQSS